MEFQNISFFGISHFYLVVVQAVVKFARDAYDGSVFNAGLCQAFAFAFADDRFAGRRADRYFFPAVFQDFGIRSAVGDFVFPVSLHQLYIIDKRAFFIIPVCVGNGGTRYFFQCFCTGLAFAADRCGISALCPGQNACCCKTGSKECCFQVFGQVHIRFLLKNR